MKINLRKANALQNAIQDAISGINFEVELEVNEFQDAEGQIATAKETWRQQFTRRSALLDAFYAIRLRVGRANVEAGISDTLADVARLEKDITLLNRLSSETARVAPEVLAGKLDKIRNRSEDNSMYSMRDRKVDTTFFDESDIQSFKSALAKNKKSKQSLQDQLLELNVATMIELDEITVATLVQEELV